MSDIKITVEERAGRRGTAGRPVVSGKTGPDSTPFDALRQKPHFPFDSVANAAILRGLS